jgi:hypothetical protein
MAGLADAVQGASNIAFIAITYQRQEEKNSESYKEDASNFPHAFDRHV